MRTGTGISHLIGDRARDQPQQKGRKPLETASTQVCNGPRRRINESVVIRKQASGSYRVEYGAREPHTERFVRDNFTSLEAAITWVERLDRSLADGAFAKGY